VEAIHRPQQHRVAAPVPRGRRGSRDRRLDGRLAAWVHNLRAAPDTEVELRGERRAVHARVADAEERGRLWPLLVESYPGFGSYQGRTEREIPVVILAPRR
jgi:deazaflavin-dependent oxidoreductase (nitroreductase family)